MKKALGFGLRLTDRNYDLIMEEAYEYRDKRGTTEHFEFYFQEYGKKNPLFWPKLSDAFWEYGNKSNLSEYAIDRVEYLQGKGERFNSVVERDAFIYILLSNRIEAELYKRNLRNRKFAILDLPLLDNTFQKWRQIKGSRAKFYHKQIIILTHWLVRIAFEGCFSKHDIEAIDMEDRKVAVRVLVTYYFCIVIPSNENNRDEDVLFTLIDKSGKGVDYLRLLPGIKRNNSFEVFRKGYSFYTQNFGEGKTGFKKFQAYELNRFKSVLACFSNIDEEHVQISKYLSKIGPLTEQEMLKRLKLEHSFGISGIDHSESLFALLAELTEKIRFLWVDDKGEGSKKDVIKNAVAVFTTDNYLKEKRQIKFGCETTTVAYILNAINEKFSPGGSFNSYAIGKSGLLFVPTVKKPSEQPECAAFGFKPLQRANIAKSLGRFNLYKNDKGKTEHRHYRQIQPIFKRLGLVVK